MTPKPITPWAWALLFHGEQFKVVECWWLRGVYRCCFWVGNWFKHPLSLVTNPNEGSNKPYKFASNIEMCSRINALVRTQSLTQHPIVFHGFGFLKRIELSVQSFNEGWNLGFDPSSRKPSITSSLLIVYHSMFWKSGGTFGTSSFHFSKFERVLGLKIGYEHVTSLS